jgi:hypothetical protein
LHYPAAGSRGELNHCGVLTGGGGHSITKSSPSL